MLIAAALFVAIMVVVVGSYWYVVERPDVVAEHALQRRLRESGFVTAETVVVQPEKLSAIKPLQSLLARSALLVRPLRMLIERSAMPVTPGAVLLGCTLLAITGGLIASFFTSWRIVHLVAASVLAPLPLAFLAYKRNARLAAFERQFPDAIDLMARSLRAGHALTTALELVGNEIPEPVGTEFRLLFERQNYGMSLEAALRGFADRVPLLDARFFVTAVLTQREVGGNLAEVFDNLAAVIRERFKIKRQIRVVSAHGRITGMVLGLLPLAVAAVLVVLSPDDMKVFIEDPIGIRLLVGAVAMQLLGVVLIKRIVNVEY